MTVSAMSDVIREVSNTSDGRRHDESESLVRPDWLTQLVREVQLLAGRSIDSSVRRPMTAILKTLSPPKSPLEAILLRGLLAECAAHGFALVQNRGTADLTSVVEAARTFIDSFYAQIGSISEISNELGVRQAFLTRCFRRTYGVSMREYLTEVRVRHGLDLLARTDLKIEAVSLLVGFKGKANFYRAVKTATGHTPLQVRMTARRKAYRNGLRRPPDSAYGDSPARDKSGERLSQGLSRTAE